MLTRDHFIQKVKMNFCPSGDLLQTSKVSVINDTTDCDVIHTLVKQSQGSQVTQW